MTIWRAALQQKTDWIPDNTKMNVASVPVRTGNARQSIHPTDAVNASDHSIPSKR